MTEQQDHTRRFAEEPTVTREQFVEASELAGIRYLDHEEAVRVCAYAVQQEQAVEWERGFKEAAERRCGMWARRAEKAEAVVAQVWEYAFTVCDPYLPETVGLRRLLAIRDAAAPEGEKESDGR